MKRIVLLVLGVAAFSSGAYAQSNAVLIEQALAAAPGRAREGAAVVKWAADHTYTMIKEGTNQLVCYSRADERDRQPFAVQCTSKMNLERVAQNRRFHAESTDAAAERALVAAADAERHPRKGRVRLCVALDEWCRPGRCSSTRDHRHAGSDHSVHWLP